MGIVELKLVQVYYDCLFGWVLVDDECLYEFVVGCCESFEGLDGEDWFDYWKGDEREDLKFVGFFECCAFVQFLGEVVEKFFEQKDEEFVGEIGKNEGLVGVEKLQFFEQDEIWYHGDYGGKRYGCDQEQQDVVLVVDVEVRQVEGAYGVHGQGCEDCGQIENCGVLEGAVLNGDFVLYCDVVVHDGRLVLFGCFFLELFEVEGYEWSMYFVECVVLCALGLV